MSGSDADLVDALLDGAACAPVERELIRCSGPDTVRFLHSLLSQSVDDLVVGDARWSFLLEPQGRVVALLRVLRAADDVLVLDTEPGVGVVLRDALLRYRIRTKCDLDAVEQVQLLARPTTAGVLDVVDGSDLALASEAELEVARIVAGVPRMRSEIGADTIPNATGLVGVATARKGCYVGQELVERIDSRGGNVPERLVVLEGRLGASSSAELLDGARSLDAPVPLQAEGDDAVVGRVTSAAVHRGVLHALGWVRRSVADGAQLVGHVDGERLEVTVRRDVGTA